MGIYWNINREAIERRKTYGKPRKLLGKRERCLFCDTLLKYNNKIKVCRKHRHQSPIFKKLQLEYRIKNRENIRRKINEYAKKHRKEKQEYDQKYRKLNSKRIDARVWKWRQEKRKKDVLFKLKLTLQSRIHNALTTHFIKNKRTIKLLGAEIAIVKEYIEKQFKEGMTWKNHGKWHIDHIIPLSSAKSKEEMEALCHYTNLQPLWRIDNLRKGKKLSTGLDHFTQKVKMVGIK